MRCAEESSSYSPAARAVLLDVARRSIEHGVREQVPLAVNAADFAPELREPRATFVTLRRARELRGCVGGLEARWPLVVDVALSAFKAAFRDSRFRPLGAEEVDGLDVSISVLSPLERLRVESDDELLALLAPGRDGLYLVEGRCSGTFLPSVWESLPEPRGFLRELKHKAGLASEHWSSSRGVSLPR